MGRRIARVTALAASVLVAASTLGLTVAQARVVSIATHVSITGKGLTFKGKVTASQPSCVSGRKVTLYRTNGNVLGSMTTGPTGRWKITASGSAGISLGHFFARVKRVSHGGAGTTLVCKAAMSSTIPFHQ